MSQTSGDPSCPAHEVSVDPTNLEPIKSDFTNGMSRRVEPDRAKHEVQVGRVIVQRLSESVLAAPRDYSPPKPDTSMIRLFPQPIFRR